MKLQVYFSILKRPPFSILLCIGLLVWLFLLLQPIVMVEFNIPVHGHAHHHIHTHQRNGLWSVIMQTINIHWFLMLIAMMFPLLSDAVLAIWRKNFPRKRYMGLTAFFIGYIIFWTFIGIVLLFLTEILNSILDSSKELVLGCILVILLFWQATPWKQMSLNRCHIPPMINPFGLQSVIDCFSYGLKKAFYCVGTCWPLMWISLVTMQHTMYLMPLFTFMMYFEQNLPWKPEQWRIPYLYSFHNFYKQLSFKQKNSTHPILRFDRKF
jgi:predicted metal-binding membrane protein